MYFNVRKPKIVPISVSDRGVMIDKEEYFYSDLKHFWIELKKDKKKPPHLLIMPKRALSQVIAIAMPLDMNPKDLREKIVQHLEEKEMAENTAYEFMEKLGF